MSDPHNLKRDGVFIGCGALLAGLLALFQIFDWGHGVTRFFLLAAVGLACLLARRVCGQILRPGAPKDGRRHATATSIFVLLLCCWGLVAHLRTAINSIRRTHVEKTIKLDQGQIVYRGLQLLRDGVNPYGRQTMLGPDEFIHRLKQWQGNACVKFQGQLRARYVRFWWREHTPQRMAELFPRIADRPECDEARQHFATLGMKYGPVQLLAHAPLIAAAGKPGLYATQLVLFLLLVALVAYLGHRWSKRSHLAAGVVLALMLYSNHLARTQLDQSCTDILAVTLAVGALALYARGQTRAAALALGLSAAAKLVPGLLYLPLLSRAQKGSRALFLGAFALPQLPFLLWDPAGLLNNLYRFPFSRWTDSTALAHYIPPALRLLLLLAVAATIVLLALKSHRAGWPPEQQLSFLLYAHLGVLATGAFFHNNYLVWILPVVALYLAQAFGAALPQQAQNADAPRSLT